MIEIENPPAPKHIFTISTGGMRVNYLATDPELPDYLISVPTDPPILVADTTYHDVTIGKPDSETMGVDPKVWRQLGVQFATLLSNAQEKNRNDGGIQAQESFIITHHEFKLRIGAVFFTQEYLESVASNKPPKEYAYYRQSREYDLRRYRDRGELLIFIYSLMQYFKSGIARCSVLRKCFGLLECLEGAESQNISTV